jgi:hypothetical protein
MLVALGALHFWRRAGGVRRVYPWGALTQGHRVRTAVAVIEMLTGALLIVATA